ncbi:MAG: hypothetical protein GY928_13135, partial [Colwellia sp.]|nr:hypothetical protein [Colwellia sp.]
QWISRLGTISFHAGTDLLFDTEEGNITVSCDGYQHIDAKNSVSIKVGIITPINKANYKVITTQQLTVIIALKL